RPIRDQKALGPFEPFFDGGPGDPRRGEKPRAFPSRSREQRLRCGSSNSILLQTGRSAWLFAYYFWSAGRPGTQVLAGKRNMDDPTLTDPLAGGVPRPAARSASAADETLTAPGSGLPNGFTSTQP